MKRKNTFYAQANILRDDGTWTKILMHRLILPGFPMLDHKNGNGLDNRLSNLRPATGSQNGQNSRPHRGISSIYKGVSWDKRAGKWQVHAELNGRQFNLGRFDDEEDAARAYDAFAREHHGPFARLNFPPRGILPEEYPELSDFDWRAPK